MRAAKILVLAVLVAACVAKTAGLKKLHKAQNPNLQTVFIYQECNVPEHENVTMAKVSRLTDKDFGGSYDAETYVFTLTDEAKHAQTCHDIWQWKESLEPCLRDEDPSDDPFVRASLDLIGDYAFKFECIIDDTVARFVVSEDVAPPEYHVDQKH